MPNKKLIVMMCVILLFVAILGFTPSTEGNRSNWEYAIMLAMEGEKLSDKEAKKLEEELKINPNDMLLRIKLLGYYSSKQFQSDSARKAHQKHVIWIIKNHPESEIARLPYTKLYPELDKESYNKAKELWLKQVEIHKNNTAILGNVANFFLINDSGIAEDFLKKAQAIDSDNPEWPERLSHLYSLEMSKKSGEPKRKAAVKSLKQLEKALNLTKEQIKKFYMLSGVAKAAYEADELTKAKFYANELLNKASQYKNDWNYGNAVHHGNLILGRLALKLGDLAKAKEYLIEAGKTPGSPQLDTFGPNMTLAKELLEKSEREIVIKYFQLCANFWEMGKDSLRNWTSIVQKGVVPDFGANLDY